MTRPFRLLAAIAALAWLAGVTPAQSYPNKPIRIVVTFPPGGSTDVVARIIQPYLERQLGQPIVIDNRPGAGGTIGIDAVAKAEPDGHVVGIGPMGALAVNVSLQEKMPYDPLKDLAPVSLLTVTPFVMAAPLASPLGSVKDVIAQAKAKPGSLAIGHGGNGTAMHLTALLFNHMAGVDIQLVPYRGSGPVMSDVAAGHITLGVGDMSSALSVMRAGRVKAIGISSAQRDPSAPDIPTFAESGLPGYESYGWFGVVAPAATPPPVLAKLNAAIVSALNDPEVAARMRATGNEPKPTSPEEFGRFIRSETAKWAEVIAKAGLKGN